VNGDVDSHTQRGFGAQLNDAAGSKYVMLQGAKLLAKQAPSVWVQHQGGDGRQAFLHPKAVAMFNYWYITQ
jgi:hypothetical protein